MSICQIWFKYVLQQPTSFKIALEILLNSLPNYVCSICVSSNTRKKPEKKTNNHLKSQTWALLSDEQMTNIDYHFPYKNDKQMSNKVRVVCTKQPIIWFEIFQ